MNRENIVGCEAFLISQQLSVSAKGDGKMRLCKTSFTGSGLAAFPVERYTSVDGVFGGVMCIQGTMHHVYGLYMAGSRLDRHCKRVDPPKA